MDHGRKPTTRKNPIVLMRRVLGFGFLFVGLALYTFLKVQVGVQQKVCEGEFGKCVWEKMKFKLYFRHGLLGAPVCGIGVDEHPGETSWDLDVSGCGGLGTVATWRDEYEKLRKVDLRENALEEWPEWVVQSIVVGSIDTLEEVDVRSNSIASLPWDIMNSTSESLVLKFDDNPCAEEVDWSGLGVDRLPTRMVGEGYNNTGFEHGLRVLKLGRNNFNESIFGELAAAGTTGIEELDVSWNRLGRVHEDETGMLEKLRRLDASGNAIGNIEDVPVHLEMLNASYCNVSSITGDAAAKLQRSPMWLRGNPIKAADWSYKTAITTIPEWVRTLENLKVVDLQYCSLSEISAGAFPQGLERLILEAQVDGINLKPDSFSGLPNLRRLELKDGGISDADLHAGLFAGTRLEELYVSASEGAHELAKERTSEWTRPPTPLAVLTRFSLQMANNPGVTAFNAPELFSGDSGSLLNTLFLDGSSLGALGEGSGTDFSNLGNLTILGMQLAKLTTIGEGAFGGLDRLEFLDLGCGVSDSQTGFENAYTSVAPSVFAGLVSLGMPDTTVIGNLTGLELNDCEKRGDGVEAFCDDAFAGMKCTALHPLLSTATRNLCELQNGEVDWPTNPWTNSTHALGYCD